MSSNGDTQVTHLILRSGITLTFPCFHGNVHIFCCANTIAKGFYDT